MTELNLYKPGIENATLIRVALENTLILGLLISGTLLLEPLHFSGWPLLSIGYAGMAGVMLVFVLRKHLCTHCWYYGKNCHCGWGKLSAILFKQHSGNYKLGGRLGGMTWGSIMIVPLLGFTVGVIVNTIRFSENWISLVIFIGFVIINGGLHKKSCDSCKMRCICPGSAGKKGC